MFLLLVILGFSQTVDSVLTASERESVTTALRNNSLTYSLDVEEERIFFYYNLDNQLFIQDFDGNILDSRKLPFPDTEYLAMHYLEEHTQLLFWDSGVGRVFIYDLNSDSLTRVDKSFSFRSFYGHGAWVDEKLNIHIMGGYGLFEYKNLFLTYDSGLKEWNMLRSRGDTPDPAQGQLFFHAQDSTYYFFSLTLPNYINVHVLSMEKLEWTKKGRYKIPINMSIGSQGLPTQVGNQKIDSNRGLIHFKLNAFYDINNDEIIFFNNPTFFTEFSGISQYHKTDDPEIWVALGRTQQQQIILAAAPVRIEELLSDSNVIRVSPEVSPMYWIFISGLFFIGGAVVVFVFNQQKKENPQQSPESAIRLEVKQDKIRLKVNGSWETVIDPTEQKFWQFTYQQLIAGVNRIELKSFDSEIFGSSLFAPQTSKKRKVLLETINHKMGQKFIFSESSSLDKRYKELVFDTNMIELDY